MSSLENIKKRFQVAFTVALFFPVLLDALYNKAGALADGNDVILSWGIVIALFIINYIILEYRTDKWFGAFIPKSINAIIFIQLVSFVIIFLILAYADHDSIYHEFLLYAFKGTLYCAMFAQVFITPFLLLNIGKKYGIL